MCNAPEKNLDAFRPLPLCRTVLDFLIALGHIVAFIARLQNGPDLRYSDSRKYGCMALGAFNVFTLMASNMWYLVLAVDLVKAIRNPFR